jgi:hypothetical protein
MGIYHSEKRSERKKGKKHILRRAATKKKTPMNKAPVTNKS